jgi:nucleoside-diphosphate-sugar epimerase
VYVSSASVYAEHGTPGQGATGAAVYDPATPEQDDPSGNDRGNYGPCKVACEQALIGAFGPERVAVCRAGLIVGPHDTTNRFGYWVSRLARGGEVLAPGTPDARVQYVDVRDLAAWLIDLAGTGVAGTFNGAGAPVSFDHFLHRVAAGVGRDGPELTWVDQDFLLAQGVRPWAGGRSLPLWVPLPAYAGFLTRDVSASQAAGLRTRDVADTARDTLTWLADRPAAPGDGDGLAPAEEAAILATWRTRTG